jgi:hypothetical protein
LHLVGSLFPHINLKLICMISLITKYFLYTLLLPVSYIAFDFKWKYFKIILYLCFSYENIIINPTIASHFPLGVFLCYSPSSYAGLFISCLQETLQVLHELAICSRRQGPIGIPRVPVWYTLNTIPTMNSIVITEKTSHTSVLRGTFLKLRGKYRNKSFHSRQHENT